MFETPHAPATRSDLMRVFAMTLAAAIAVVAAAAVWWSIENPTYVHRFRLGIEVEVDGEVRRGSSVIEVRTTDYNVGMPGAKGTRSRVIGEAVFVDLGKNRNVIAALATGPAASVDGIANLTFTAFLPNRPALKHRDVPNLAGSAPLAGQQLPTLVTFSDLGDPKTARAIAPEEFEQVFGSDVRFRRAFVEMVPAGSWPFNAIGWPASLAGEPVTRGLEKTMPWLPHPQCLSGRSGCDTYKEPHCLHGGHFTRS
jgi:hypothetical protein